MSTITIRPSDSNEIIHVLRGETLPSAVRAVKEEPSSEKQQVKKLPTRETLRIDAFHELVDALKGGLVSPQDLPSAFMEVDRIVAPLSQEGKTFQGAMERLTGELLPKLNLQEHPITFLVADTGATNAYIVPGARQSVVCFERELLSSCKNLDQLAWVLLHELTHLKVRSVFPELPNSQGEEGLCDIRPLMIMHDAGFDPRQAEEYARIMAKLKVPVWASIVDVHALPAYRVDSVQNGLVVLRQVRGDFQSSPRDLPVELKTTEGALANARHRSYVERALEAADYASKTPAERAAILESLLRETRESFFRRVDDIRRTLYELKVAAKDTPTRQILERMIDSLFDRPMLFNELYSTLHACLNQSAKPGERSYYGRIAKLAEKVQDFINSESSSRREKESAAEKLLTELQSIPNWQLLTWQSVRLPHFMLRSEKEYKRALARAKRDGEAVPLPWHNLAEAALPTDQIAQALLVMGTWDTRILSNVSGAELRQLMAQEGLKPHPKDRLVTISTPRSTDGTVDRGSLSVADGKVEALNGDAAERHIRAESYKRVAEAHKLSVHHRIASATSITSKAGTKLSFIHLPVEEFLKDPWRHLASNYHLLWGTAQPGWDAQPLDKAAKDLEPILPSSRQLLEYFDTMLDASSDTIRTAAARFIRAFFLSKKRYASYESSRMYLSSTIWLGTPFAFDRLDEIGCFRSYLRWICADRHQLFSVTERGTIISPFSLPLEQFRQAIGLQDPTASPCSIEELKERIARYSQLEPNGTIWSVVALAAEYINSSRLKGGAEAAVIEAAWFFREQINKSATDRKPDFDLVEFLGVDKRVLISLCNLKDCSRALDQTLRREMRWPGSAAKLADIYVTLEELKLFPDETWRTDFVKRLLARLDVLPNLSKRIEVLEKLLLERTVRDIDIREAAVTRWVAAAAEMYGCDNSPHWDSEASEYLQKIQPLLDRVALKGAAPIRLELLGKLGDTIVAQRQVSHAIESAVIAFDQQRVRSGGAVYGVSQTLFSVVSKDDRRKDLLLFLTRPLTEGSIDTVMSRLQSVDDPKLLYQQLLGERVEADDLDIESLNRNKAKRLARLELKRLHDNFWKAPTAVRVGLLEELLIPANHRLRDHERGVNTSFDEAAEFVISEFFPLTEADGTPRRYASEARTFLRAFLAPGVLDHRQRPVFLAALMAATKVSESQQEKMRVGQLLVTLFHNMGPAWRKLGQAISSHPSTPADIAHDMERLKGSRSVSRWEAWSLYENLVPEAIRRENPRLGPVLESASFFTAIEVGAEVCTLMTPNALLRAEDGFSIMESFVKELQKTAGTLVQAAPSVNEMVQSARTSAILETNSSVGAAQHEAMTTRYNGLAVQIGEVQYRFSTALWRDHGPEFRRMQRIPGDTFNDLPEGTEEQRQHKRMVAKAIVYVELRNILSGAPFCVDRHGRNMRVDGASIGHFDHGAVHAVVRDREGRPVHPLNADKALDNGGSVEIPGASNDEKLQLAEALWSGFSSMSEDNPLSAIIHGEVEKLRQSTGSNPEYLIRVERALLNLSDCFRWLDREGSDLFDILGSLHKNGAIDPVICDVLEKRVKETFGQVFGGSLSSVANHWIQQPIVEIQKPVTIEDPSRWHDVPKNRLDYPTLLTEADLKRYDKAKTSKKRRRSSR